MFAIYELGGCFRIVSGGEMWAEKFTSYCDAYEFAERHI